MFLSQNITICISSLYKSLFMWYIFHEFKMVQSIQAQSWIKLLTWQLSRKHIFDTLFVESKLWRVIAESVGCSQSWTNGKGCTSKIDICCLERILKQNWFKNLKEIYRESKLRLNSVYQEPPSRDVFRKCATSVTLVECQITF